VQNDPSLGWRNMLLDRFKQIVKGDDIRNNTLVDLDKAFWQNINTVRVTAAGDSNFTLAKDDVGNWYVKAMGADPKAMIEAAKGMALYNLGGRFDANLLRIDELRQQADVFQRRGDAVPDDIKSELAGLSGAQSGAGVGARNQTLSLFVKNYDEQSVAHLKDLAAKLSAGVYQQALFDRWTASLQGGSNVRALDPLLADPDAAAQLQQATVAAAGEAGAEAPAAGMVKALQALNRLRSTLKTLVRGHTPLVAAELEAVRQSKAQLDALQPRLKEADTQVVNADAAVAQAEEALKKSDTAATRQEDSRAREAAKLRRAELKQLSDQAVAERARLAAADVSLVAAQKRQAAAVADVDAVLKSAVEDFANRRLRVVEETETAVKVIGTATP
jgi:hypothetical protein